MKFLKINPDKREIVVFLPAHLSSKMIINGTILTNGECIRFSNSVKNVGFTLDKQPSKLDDSLRLMDLPPVERLWLAA